MLYVWNTYWQIINRRDRQVGSGSKFDYNFFHSQVRISIECAFGMLVNRWGILRRALPATFGIRKTGSLTHCLCRLHNYCINQNASVEKPLTADLVEIRSAGVPICRKRVYLPSRIFHFFSQMLADERFEKDFFLLNDHGIEVGFN